MRIAILVSATQVNGVAVHCHLLTKYLTSRGHQILLVHRPFHWIEEQPAFQAVERLVTSFRRVPSELIRVGNHIGEFNADVIHTHMSSAHAYGSAFRLFGRLPIVATAHATHFQLHWPLNHRVIATSPAAARYHHRVNLVPWRKLSIIPNFVETDRFRPASASESKAARVALGLPANAFVIGSVGALHERKRPADLVRAFAPVASARADAYLLLVGVGEAGPIAAELRRLAAEFGFAERLILAGVRCDMPQVFAAIDLFAFASRLDSGPIAMLEALASGLPVVTTDVGMTREFVIEGQSGHIVAIGDSAALGERIAALAADEGRRARFGAAARAHVERNFAIEMVAPKVEAVLAEAAAIRPRPPLAFLARAFGVKV